MKVDPYPEQLMCDAARNKDYCTSIDGRKVTENLLPGANYVRVLSPGVYFVTERGERRTVCARKVILQ